jgi:hypothetical protein
MKKHTLRLLLLSILFLFPFEEVFADSEPVATDVTPTSFCVVWYSGEDCDPSLNIFQDENGTQALTGVVLTVQPTVDPNSDAGAKAASEGILKVRAEGLTPDTTYFFQAVTVIKSTDQTVVFPLSAPFPSVTTQVEVSRHEGYTPFSNDLCAVEVYVWETFTNDDCGLAVALFEGSAHPISAFVGDSIYEAMALLDLHNLFDRETGKSLSLNGGETVTIYFMTKQGVSEGYPYWVHSPSGLSTPREEIPFFGDFVGAYGVDMGDAIAGLQTLTDTGIDIKTLHDISSAPRRGMGEIVYVLQRLSEKTRP